MIGEGLSVELRIPITEEKMLNLCKKVTEKKVSGKKPEIKIFVKKSKFSAVL